MKHVLFAAAIGILLQPTWAIAQRGTDEVSLRLGGREVPISPGLRERLAGLAREMLHRCGPNTRQHPDNFGPAAIGVERRWERVLEGSRLRVVFAAPIVTES